MQFPSSPTASFLSPGTSTSTPESAGPADEIDRSHPRPDVEVPATRTAARMQREQRWDIASCCVDEFGLSVGILPSARHAALRRDLAVCRRHIAEERYDEADLALASIEARLIAARPSAAKFLAVEPDATSLWRALARFEALRGHKPPPLPADPPVA